MSQHYAMFPLNREVECIPPHPLSWERGLMSQQYAMSPLNQEFEHLSLACFLMGRR